MSIELTKELLDERFIIDPKTGIILNRIKTAQRTKVGEEAGSLRPDGYRRIKINGRLYYTSRIIWFFVQGEWPDCIDHVNHLKTDNRIVNLRNVTHAENHRNRSKRSDNTSGVAGVHWHKATSKWQSLIQVNSKQIHLGYFSNIADAITARAAAKVEFGFHQNHA